MRSRYSATPICYDRSSRVAKRLWVSGWRRLVQPVSSLSRGLVVYGPSVQSTRLLKRSLLDHGTLVVWNRAFLMRTATTLCGQHLHELNSMIQGIT